MVHSSEMSKSSLQVLSNEDLGKPFGVHRVLVPSGVLPQPAIKLNNDFQMIDETEILVDVEILNVDSASFTEIKKRASGDLKAIEKMILEIVDSQGKLKNPWTGSGGMFIGKVHRVGHKRGKQLKELGNELNPGDFVASLVSLSMTPLKISKIKKILIDRDQVEIEGQAILFEKSLWAKLPQDLPQSLALSVLDVAGAPAQVMRLVKEGQIVAVIGARGKSGMLSCYAAFKKVGPQGRVIAVTPDGEGINELKEAPFIHEIVVASATDALGLLKAVEKATNGSLCDVVINCVNVENCEMGTILITKERGVAYFFSMATSFTKASLGAESVGKDIDLLMGNGYCKNHAEITLNIMRESEYLRKLYEKRYSQ